MSNIFLKIFNNCWLIITDHVLIFSKYDIIDDIRRIEYHYFEWHYIIIS